MQAAMPFVDDFLPVHNLASLETLAAHLASLAPRRSRRRARLFPDVASTPPLVGAASRAEAQAPGSPAASGAAG
jgi:hypothetical protein